MEVSTQLAVEMGIPNTIIFLLGSKRRHTVRYMEIYTSFYTSSQYHNIGYIQMPFTLATRHCDYGVSPVNLITY